MQKNFVGPFGCSSGNTIRVSRSSRTRRTGLRSIPWFGERRHFEIKLVTPRRDSKAVRFNDHLPKIRNKHIHLPEFAIWREAFVDEVIAFPGEFDDQVDAMTQYLDFMETDPIIPAPRTREPLIARVNASTIRWRRR